MNVQFRGSNDRFHYAQPDMLSCRKYFSSSAMTEEQPNGHIPVNEDKSMPDAAQTTAPSEQPQPALQDNPPDAAAPPATASKMEQDPPATTAAAAPPQPTPTPAPTPGPLPIRQYLETTVVPILMTGMQQLSKERPEDPIDWLAEYLKKNNPKKES